MISMQELKINLLEIAICHKTVTPVRLSNLDTNRSDIAYPRTKHTVLLVSIN